MTLKITYCVDTSTLIQAWDFSYRIQNHPTFWSNVKQLVDNERFTICEEVRTEIEAASEELSKWIKLSPSIVTSFDHCQELIVKQIMKEYPRLVSIKKNKGWADPFVIALAKSRDFTVVTEEGLGDMNGPRIPYVCNKLELPCTNLYDLISTERWTF